MDFVTEIVALTDGCLCSAMIIIWIELAAKVIKELNMYVCLRINNEDYYRIHVFIICFLFILVSFYSNNLLPECYTYLYHFLWFCWPKQNFAALNLLFHYKIFNINSTWKKGWPRDQNIHLQHYVHRFNSQ